MGRLGIILSSGDYASLYAAATLAATALARGDNVVIFVTGRALPMFTRDHTPPAEEPARRMLELKVYWRDLLAAAKPMGGLEIIACETAAKVMGVEEDALDRELVDEVGSMYTFLEKVGDGQLLAF